MSTWLRATVGAGHAALALGDTEAATEAFRLAHDRAIEVGDRRAAGPRWSGLASLARRAGDDERCVALLQAATGEALGGGDPTDAVTAAGMLAEMLLARDAVDEAAVLLGATAELADELRVRIDFGLAYDAGPVRAAVAERLGEQRMADLAGDGLAIGLAARSGGPPTSCSNGGRRGAPLRRWREASRSASAASPGRRATPQVTGREPPASLPRVDGRPWTASRPCSPSMASTVRPAGKGRAVEGRGSSASCHGGGRAPLGGR